MEQPEDKQNQITSKRFSSRFWITLLIIVILGLVVGGFGIWKTVYAPNNDLATFNKVNRSDGEKKDWKSYSDIMAGFSLLYPKDWQLLPGQNKGGDATFPGITLKYPGETNEGLFVNYFQDLASEVGSSDLKYLKDNNLELFLSDPKFYSNLQTVTLAGQTAYRVTYTNPGVISETRIWLKTDLFIYEISYDNTDPQKDEFEKVIQTFAIQKPTDTATWKTYNSKSLNLQLKYPPDWIVKEKDDQVSFNSLENEKLLKKINSGEVYGEGYKDTVTIQAFHSIEQEPSNVFEGDKAHDIPDLIMRNPFSDRQYQIFQLGPDTLYRTRIGGFGVYDVSFVSHNGRLYEITLVADNPEPPWSVRIPLLQSLKFNN